MSARYWRTTGLRLELAGHWRLRSALLLPGLLFGLLSVPLMGAWLAMSAGTLLAMLTCWHAKRSLGRCDGYRVTALEYEGYWRAILDAGAAAGPGVTPARVELTPLPGPLLLEHLVAARFRCPGGGQCNFCLLRGDVDTVQWRNLHRLLRETR